MVKFGRSVSYLFGRLVNYSAFQFSIYSAIWIRPSVPVRCHRTPLDQCNHLKCFATSKPNKQNIFKSCDICGSNL